MKRWSALMLCAILTLTLVACAVPSAPSLDPTSTPDLTAEPSQTAAPVETPAQESAQPETPDASVEPETSETPDASETGSNILIAYFTWAENTHVENPDAVDADATTSASVLLPGNAARIAGWIQERTGGDLFSIVVAEPYSSDYDECLDRAADEKAENARPALVGSVENMAQYDVVFLGFPNWWYTVPMAVHSFIDSYDFSGKTVIPFVTHGTGGLSGTIRDMTASLPDDVTVLEPIGVYRPEVEQSQPAVMSWLDGLGYTQTTLEEGADTQKRMILEIDGQQLTVLLNDTTAANAVYDMLPMELTFTDYNGVEKISYLEDALPTDGDPDSCDPQPGDFCLYEPWGNLSIFYQDFRQSNGLIPLGRIESNVDLIAGQHEDFLIKLYAAQ